VRNVQRHEMRSRKNRSGWEADKTQTFPQGAVASVGVYCARALLPHKKQEKKTAALFFFRALFLMGIDVIADVLRLPFTLNEWVPIYPSSFFHFCTPPPPFDELRCLKWICPLRHTPCGRHSAPASCARRASSKHC
jgi:hypothetical protein